MHRRSIVVSLVLVVVIGGIAAANEPAASPDREQAEAGPTIGFSWFPIVYYTPETSVAAGGGVVLTRRAAGSLPTDRPDSLQLFAVYTAKNQVFLRTVPELFFNGGRGRFQVELTYLDMPTSSFGIGNDPDLDRDEIDDVEQEYTSERFSLETTLLHRVAGSLRAGASHRFSSERIYDVERPGMLPAADGDRSGLGPAVEWDSRDTAFAPTRGGWYQAAARFYRDDLGSDFDYRELGVDLRHYFPMRPGHVLAIQAVAEAVRGEAPFTELPTPPLRGLYQDVFRDRTMAAVQAEWRFPLRGRFSAAAFAGLAGVGHDLGDVSLTDLYAAGAGVRYMLNRQERLGLRLDVGVSPWGVFPYFMIFEAF